jgi:hypothetical protein
MYDIIIVIYFKVNNYVHRNLDDILHTLCRIQIGIIITGILQQIPNNI